MNTETALMARQCEALEAPMPAESNALAPRTSQELRVIEVSEALAPAYAKASTLELSDEEIEALMAPFADDYVEIRSHDGLIFIPHIHISNRLNKVLKPGKWALIRRREWFDASSSTMFGEYILVIRGCYVGESVGGHQFQPTNPKINYSDTLESTAAEALRRIAGKRLSLGSQVWDPEYCRQWQAKYGLFVRGKWERRMLTSPDYPVPNQDAPSDSAPTSERPTVGGNAAQETPFKADWRAVSIHFGKNEGQRLGDLDARTLSWYQNQWQPKPYKGRIDEKSLALRAALDASLKENKDEKESPQSSPIPAQEKDDSGVPF